MALKNCKKKKRNKKDRGKQGNEERTERTSKKWMGVCCLQCSAVLVSAVTQKRNSVVDRREGGVAKMSASEEYDGDYDEKPDHFTFEVAWEVANKGEYMFLLVAFGIQASKIKYGYKVDIFSYLHLFLCCSFMKTVNVTDSQTSLTNWLT